MWNMVAIYLNALEYVCDREFQSELLYTTKPCSMFKKSKVGYLKCSHQDMQS